jgi:hypothetical protein
MIFKAVQATNPCPNYYNHLKRSSKAKARQFLRNPGNRAISIQLQEKKKDLFVQYLTPLSTKRPFNCPSIYSCDLIPTTTPVSLTAATTLILPFHTTIAIITTLPSPP